MPHVCCLLDFSMSANAAEEGKGATATPESPSSVLARRTTTPIVIDGHLDEPVWQTEGTSAFTQIMPQERAAPSERTIYWVAYDDQTLYVAVRLYDHQPQGIVARMARRDTSLESDSFMVALDPYHNRRDGFLFKVYASGAFVDGTLSNAGNSDTSWDGV